MNRKYNHAEAFCHMIYYGTSNAGQIQLKIWNSRDGVTPFMTFSKEYGIHLQHNSHNDPVDPFYKPKKGDLIWVSYTEETAKEAAEEAYNSFSEHLSELNKMDTKDIIEKFGGYDGRGQLTEMMADKEAFISKQVHEILYEHGEPQPRLHLVEEDWK